MRSEDEFIEEIDCRFPYGDVRRAQALVDEACAISANAAFMVVHELARRPLGSGATDATCMSLLERLDSRFSHPLMGVVLGLARRMVRREAVPVDECTAVMHRIAAHPGHFNALSIAYFACGDGENEALDRLSKSIQAEWRRGLA